MKTVTLKIIVKTNNYYLYNPDNPNVRFDSGCTSFRYNQLYMNTVRNDHNLQISNQQWNSYKLSQKKN